MAKRPTGRLKATWNEARGAWIIRGTIAGSRVFRTATGTRKAEAEAEARAIEEKMIARATLGPGATLTLTEAALAYVQRGGEGRFLRPIVLHFGAEFLLADLDNLAIDRAAAAIYPDAAPNTVQRQLITPLAAIYQEAARDGTVPPKMFQRRGKPKKRVDWLTPEQAEDMITAALDLAPHILRPIALMLGGGLRSSETLQVSAATLYTTTGEAWIPETKSGDPRMIRLPRRALDLITAEDLPETGPICLTPKGAPYVIRQNGGGQMKGAFDKIAHEIALPFKLTPHVLRHTWATWFHAQTHDFGALLDLGGWARADVANIYRKIAPEDLSDRLAAHQWDFTRADFRRKAAAAPALRVVGG